MNILDITNEDIETLKNNWKIWGGLTEREREVLNFFLYHECVQVFGNGLWYNCSKNYKPTKDLCFRIEPDYTLPAPTEADIIKYLQASEVPPAKWHPAAQEWARRHEREKIWEYFSRHPLTWDKTSNLGGWVTIPHRLRADYGRKDVGYVEFTDPPKSINPSDVSYGPFTLEPEVCVWDKHCNPKTYYTDPHGEHCFMHIKDINKGRFCPVCGKRIEVK